MNVYFSPSNLGFIPASWKDDGSYSDKTWPADAVLLTDDEADVYWKTNPPEGKQLGSNKKGRPVWVDIPAPTHEALVDDAERERQRRTDAANDYMNDRQWPGKAVIGRLKGDDLAKYNLWLDYLDSLESVDTSTAPNIVWPKVPE